MVPFSSFGPFFRFFTGFIFPIVRGVNHHAFLPFSAFFTFYEILHLIWMKRTFCSFFAPREITLQCDVFPHAIWFKWSFGKKCKIESKKEVFVKVTESAFSPCIMGTLLTLMPFFRFFGFFRFFPKSFRVSDFSIFLPNVENAHFYYGNDRNFINFFPKFFRNFSEIFPKCFRFFRNFSEMFPFFSEIFPKCSALL